MPRSNRYFPTQGAQAVGGMLMLLAALLFALHQVVAGVVLFFVGLAVVMVARFRALR